MNDALIALMIVTATGIQTGPTFQSYEECESVSQQITLHESFCYYQTPVDINAAINQLGNIMKQMKDQFNEIENEDS